MLVLHARTGRRRLLTVYAAADPHSRTRARCDTTLYLITFRMEEENDGVSGYSSTCIAHTHVILLSHRYGSYPRDISTTTLILSTTNGTRAHENNAYRGLPDLYRGTGIKSSWVSSISKQCKSMTRDGRHSKTPSPRKES